jgi:hypothetical protein
VAKKICQIVGTLPKRERGRQSSAIAGCGLDIGSTDIEADS